MYLPTHFRSTHLKTEYDLIEKFDFALLISTTGSGVQLNHFPFLLDIANPTKPI